MRNAPAAALFVVTAAMAVAAQAPIKVESIALASPVRVGEIDTDKTKGQPSRLAWSPDGAELYVQMMDGQFGVPGAKLAHHVYRLDGGQHQELPAEPEWATDYWTVKSGQASPDSDAFKIELKKETRTEKTVSTPMGGDLARGGVAGSGTSTGDAISAAYNAQRVNVYSMVLHGEVVGEYVNAPIVPGQTFGWGPKGSRVVAYSALKSGRIVVMDADGRKREIDGTKDAVFPAWSPDGSHLAWLQKDGRKKFILQVARVSHR